MSLHEVINQLDNVVEATSAAFKNGFDKNLLIASGVGIASAVFTKILNLKDIIKSDEKMAIAVGGMLSTFTAYGLTGSVAHGFYSLIPYALTYALLPNKKTPGEQMYDDLKDLFKEDNKQNK